MAETSTCTYSYSYMGCSLGALYFCSLGDT